jgi:hypothetical protein
MDVREKLVEIIQNSVGGCARHWAEVIADGLIAHGVTVQEWHPRTESPEKNGRYLCRYVFNDNYDMPFEQVLSYYATDEKPHFRNEGSELGMKVTHWMPLPQPPKG